MNEKKTPAAIAAEWYEKNRTQYDRALASSRGAKFFIDEHQVIYDHMVDRNLVTINAIHEEREDVERHKQAVEQLYSERENVLTELDQLEDPGYKFDAERVRQNKIKELEGRIEVNQKELDFDRENLTRKGEPDPENTKEVLKYNELVAKIEKNENAIEQDKKLLENFQSPLSENKARQLRTEELKEILKHIENNIQNHNFEIARITNPTYAARTDEILKTMELQQEQMKRIMVEQSRMLESYIAGENYNPKSVTLNDVEELTVKDMRQVGVYVQNLVTINNLLEQEVKLKLESNLDPNDPLKKSKYEKAKAVLDSTVKGFDSEQREHVKEIVEKGRENRFNAIAINKTQEILEQIKKDMQTISQSASSPEEKASQMSELSSKAANMFDLGREFLRGRMDVLTDQLESTNSNRESIVKEMSALNKLVVQISDTKQALQSASQKPEVQENIRLGLNH